LVLECSHGANLILQANTTQIYITLSSDVLCKVCFDLKDRRKEWDAPWGGLKLKKLKRAASRCPSGGCNILLEAISKFAGPELMEDESTISGAPSQRTIGGWGYGTFGYCPSSKPWPGMYIKLFVAEGMYVVYTFLVADELLFKAILSDIIGEQHPIWTGIIRSACPQDLSHGESLAFVNRHLETCAREHASCRLNARFQDFMPRRVVDVGIVDDGLLDPIDRAPVRVVESASILEGREYVCLSHRWSSPEEMTITTEVTYTSNYSEIRFLDLGPTFRDAVHIARRLNVRYVWIDSLCIIQDSKAD
jgi:hypothetical protein